MKKITISILLLCIILITCVSKIQAESLIYEGDTFTIRPTPDKTTAKPGDVIIVDLYIDDINVTTGEQGIGSYTAKWEYDSNIFEMGEVTRNQ